MTCIFANVIFVLAISVLMTFVFVGSRRCFRLLTADEMGTLSIFLELIGVLFALLVTFSISNLWNRYYDIRLLLETQFNQLRKIYITVKLMPNTEEIQENIKIYANLLATEQLNALAKNRFSASTEKARIVFENSALLYVQKNQPNNQDIVLDNLYSGEEGVQILTTELDQVLYVVVLITGFLTLAGFWFLGFENGALHFAISFLVIAIISFSTLLVFELSNPFSSDILRKSLENIYDSFLNELEQP